MSIDWFWTKVNWMMFAQFERPVMRASPSTCRVLTIDWHVRGMCRCLWQARGLCLCPCVATYRGLTSLPSTYRQKGKSECDCCCCSVLYTCTSNLTTGSIELVLSFVWFSRFYYHVKKSLVNLLKTQCTQILFWNPFQYGLVRKDHPVP